MLANNFEEIFGIKNNIRHSLKFTMGRSMTSIKYLDVVIYIFLRLGFHTSEQKKKLGFLNKRWGHFGFIKFSNNLPPKKAQKNVVIKKKAFVHNLKGQNVQKAIQSLKMAVFNNSVF